MKPLKGGVFNGAGGAVSPPVTLMESTPSLAFQSLAVPEHEAEDSEEDGAVDIS